MALVVGEERENGEVKGYYVLENNKRELYCAEYFKTLLKTGKMTVKNMKYDTESQQLLYTGDNKVTVNGVA